MNPEAETANPSSHTMFIVGAIFCVLMLAGLLVTVEARNLDSGPPLMAVGILGLLAMGIYKLLR